MSSYHSGYQLCFTNPELRDKHAPAPLTRRMLYQLIERWASKPTDSYDEKVRNIVEFARELHGLRPGGLLPLPGSTKFSIIRLSPIQHVFEITYVDTAQGEEPIKIRINASSEDDALDKWARTTPGNVVLEVGVVQ